MKTKSPQLDWREGRRRRAWELKGAGWKQQDIAAALGVTAGAVSQRLKRVELGNHCCSDLAELALALRRAKERLRHKRTVIQACVRQAGYHM